MTQTPVLLLVDFQNEHTQGSGPHYVKNAHRIVDDTSHLLTQARRYGWTIVHLQMKTQGGYFDQKKDTSGPIQILKPRRSEHVFQHTQISPFSNDKFSHFIASFRRAPIFICGFTAPYAVLSTVTGCVGLNLNVYVLDDLVGSSGINNPSQSSVDKTYKSAIGRLVPLLKTIELEHITRSIEPPSLMMQPHHKEPFKRQLN